MNLTHQTPTLTSVRLFPRLASKPVRRSRVIRRSATKPRRAVANPASPTQSARRDEVRLRLLKMIVENERVRRQEPHAS
jgi:hypothetical protein